MKNQKGITLVALVVTIIVLLILAAVSLSLVAGSDGLLNRASNAVDKTTEAEIVEEIELAMAQLKTDYYYERYILSPTQLVSFGEYLSSHLNGYVTSHGTLILNGTALTYRNNRTNVETVGTFDESTGTITILGRIIGASGSANAGGNQGGNENPGNEELATNNMAELEVDDIEANVDAINSLSAEEKAARKTALEDTTKIKTVLTGNTPVPVGFTYVEGTATEANSAGTNGWGVVIQDSNENEFVWVPVPDAKVLYDTIEATEVGKNDSVKVASLLEMPIVQFASTGVNTTKKSKSGILSNDTENYIYCDTRRGDIDDTSGYREPALVTTYDLDSDYYTQAGFASAEAMAQAFVTDYNNMIESIAKYGGFYVGRYEISFSDASGNEGSEDLNHEFASGTTAHVKSGRAPADEFNWYQLYKACRSFGNSTVTSTMIWGCQWDILCLWGATSGDEVSYSEYDESRHSYDYIEVTGSNSDDKRNNVFDLEGSRYEWTQEAADTDGRVYRGGNYLSYYGSGSYTYSYPYDGYDSYLGSRATLYIK